jgi:hypothetical protein
MAKPFITNWDHEILKYIQDGDRTIEADFPKILINCTSIKDGNMSCVIVPFKTETENYNRDTKMFIISKSNL